MNRAISGCTRLLKAYRFVCLRLRLQKSKSRAKKYVFPANDRKLESLVIETSPTDDSTTLVFRIDGTEQRIVCGRGAWPKGKIAWASWPARPAAASGAWTGDDSFTAKLCFYETPFVNTIRLKLSGDEVRVQSEANVGFGSTRESELVGKAE